MATGPGRGHDAAFPPVNDFLTAIGLVLVIEGALYALMPGLMKRMMVDIQSVPAGVMRAAGLAAVVAGLGLVWLIRR